MSRTTGTPRADLAAWGVERIRLTTFHPIVVKAEGWWERMTGQEPDSVVGKKTGERAEMGAWEGMTLALQIQPKDGRIDWFASEVPDSPPSLSERLPAFVGLMNRWLASDLFPHPTNRMAFGVVANLPVANPEEGYRRLSDYLPFDVDRTTSSDFLYQINRQRESATLPGTRINRLMKWSVGVFFLQAMRLDGSGVVKIAELTKERSGCRLELDINPPPQEGQPLPQDRLQPLFAEMVALGEEIVREGDIP
jgi:hypothetical protein